MDADLIPLLIDGFSKRGERSTRVLDALIYLANTDRFEINLLFLEEESKKGISVDKNLPQIIHRMNVLCGKVLVHGIRKNGENGILALLEMLDKFGSDFETEVESIKNIYGF